MSNSSRIEERCIANAIFFSSPKKGWILYEVSVVVSGRLTQGKLHKDAATVSLSNCLLII
jgi:hypothetical protein